MSESMRNLAAAMVALENEVGLEELSQVLANSLLACSKKLVGDASNSWTVKTSFVKGEVTVITDEALVNVKGL